MEDALQTPTSPRRAIWQAAKDVALFALGSLVAGEIILTISWLMVDANAGWRDRSSSHAFSVGAVLLLAITALLGALRGLQPLTRATSAVGAAAAFTLLCIPRLPQALGGLAPACAVVYVLDENPRLMQALAASSGVSEPVEILFSDESFHHLRLPDGSHMMVKRDFVMLATCP